MLSRLLLLVFVLSGGGRIRERHVEYWARCDAYGRPWHATSREHFCKFRFERAVLGNATHRYGSLQMVLVFFNIVLE